MFRLFVDSRVELTRVWYEKNKEKITLYYLRRERFYTNTSSNICILSIAH